jgi:hypothetical protein
VSAVGVSFSQRGNFEKTLRFLKAQRKLQTYAILQHYGARGVAELAAATPADTGLTAGAWSYVVEDGGGTYSINFTNSEMTTDGVPIVVLLTFGHGTRTGGYVSPNNFINPALQPIFDQILEQAWKAVTSA